MFFSVQLLMFNNFICLFMKRVARGSVQLDIKTFLASLFTLNRPISLPRHSSDSMHYLSGWQKVFVKTAS